MLSASPVLKVSFKSEGIDLAGNLYVPDDYSQPTPAIVPTFRRLTGIN